VSDIALAENPRAVAGGNGPPEPTPYEIAEQKISDLYDECQHWLDGAPVECQDHADGIGNLKGLLRKAITAAEAARVAEKKPFDEQIAEIQDRYNLLIGDTKKVKGKAVRAIEACDAALHPWLIAEKRRIDEEAKAKREAAEKARRLAEEALRTADESNLTAIAAAEDLVVEAKAAATVANKAERQTTTVGGSFGTRAIGLRSFWVATITDPKEFARYIWANHQNEITDLLPAIAQRLATQRKADMPGCTVTETHKAV
jgi:hypothetical protein